MTRRRTTRLKRLDALADAAWLWRRRSRSMTWSDELLRESEDLEAELIQKARDLIRYVDRKKPSATP